MNGVWKIIRPVGSTVYAPMRRAVVVACLWPALGSAQNLLLELPSAPSGYLRASSIGRVSSRSPEEQGLYLSASLAASYDSNLTHGSGAAGRPKEDDFVISPGFDATYATKGAFWLGGVRVAASYDQYFDHDDYSGLNYDLGVFAGYNGGKLTATYFGALTGARGSDIYSFRSEPVERINLSNRAILRYRVSPKTSLRSTISHQTSWARTAGYYDTSSLNLGLAALWQATPLIEVGPGLRYALRTGENRSDTSTAGPNLNLNYQLSEKVTLRSTFGVDYRIEPGGGDPEFNSSFGLRYKASELWNASLTYYRDTNSNPNIVDAIDEISSLRLGYQRKVRRFTLDLGAGWTARSTERVRGGALASEEFDLITLDAALTFPLFGDSADLKVATRYQDLSADSSARSWDGWQTGMGFSWRF